MKMTEYFRQRIIRYFLKTERINKSMAHNLLSWKHSGFSIDNSVEMKVVAVIMDSVGVDKILRHLVKTGKSPPCVGVNDLGMVS